MKYADWEKVRAIRYQYFTEFGSGVVRTEAISSHVGRGKKQRNNEPSEIASKARYEFRKILKEWAVYWIEMLDENGECLSRIEFQEEIIPYQHGKNA